MAYTSIISASELAGHLNDPNWVIVDSSFNLSQKEWGFEHYQQSHIPGAVYAHMGRDLASPVRPDSGRHPLPELPTFLKTLESWGIAPHKQVVIYDTLDGSYAARLWCMLRMLGHSSAAVLSGGFQAWENDGYPQKQGIESNPPASYPLPNELENVFAPLPEVECIRQDPSFLLLDARSPERYRGDVEPIDTIAGHIPGAVNRFNGENLQADGTFKPAEQLKAEFLSLLGDRSPDRIIAYCGSGVTSCHHLLAMEAAGLTGARVYVGSWSEWIRDPARPVARS